MSQTTAQLVSEINGGPIAGTRNRVINGDMRIDQRNAGASITPTDNTYSLDRWKFRVAQTSKLTVQQNAASVATPAGFANYLGVTSSSAYSLISTDYFVSVQDVEGFNFSDFDFGTANAKTVTLSFWVRSSLTGTFNVALRNSAANRSYPVTYTISTANTWEQKTITIPGDSTGTWVGATNGIGASVIFNLGCGSTYNGTSGSWQTGNYTSVSGATSVVGTNGATFYITGVQLEPGSTATPFERRSYGQELALCQRYYEIIKDGDLTGGAFNATNLFAALRFTVEKRAAPTMSIVTNGSWVGNGANGTLNSVAFSNANLRAAQLDSSSFTGSVTAGYFYVLRSFDYRASAEL